MDCLKNTNTEDEVMGEPVKLNVYDLTDMNGYLYWFGLGVYHSAIEAYGVEYAYGAHDYPTSGVFEVEPQQCPGFKFRKSMTLGTVQMGPEKFRDFVEEISYEYYGDSYHLLYKNCNHFCEDVCRRLLNASLPGWVNRLAKIGTLCSCCLPDGLPPEGIEADYGEMYGGPIQCSEQSKKCSDENHKCSDKNEYHRLLNDDDKTTRKRRLICSSAFIHSSLKDGIAFSRDHALSKSLKGGTSLSRDWKEHAFTKKPPDAPECCKCR